MLIPNTTQNKCFESFPDLGKFPTVKTETPIYITFRLPYERPINPYSVSSLTFAIRGREHLPTKPYHGLMWDCRHA